MNNMNITFITDGKGAVKGQLVEGRATPLGERSEAGVVENLQALGTPASGMLPPGVRWISASGRQVLFERPPRRMRFEYSPKQANHPEPKFRDVEIELPWTVYAIVFSSDFQIRSLQVYAANQELRSVDDHLGLMPMANTHADGHFCLPPQQPKAEDLAEAIQNAYQMMWHSKFNMDVWDLLHQALAAGRPRLMVAEPTAATAPKASRLLRRWEELTRDEVLSIVDWPQVTTVSQVINNLNQYAVGAFTGWHLMSTAKQAFMTAPAKEGHQQSEEGSSPDTFHFDNTVEAEAYVAQTNAELNVLRDGAALRRAQARVLGADVGWVEHPDANPVEHEYRGQVHIAEGEEVRVYTGQEWIPVEAPEVEAEPENPWLEPERGPVLAVMQNGILHPLPEVEPERLVAQAEAEHYPDRIEPIEPHPDGWAWQHPLEPPPLEPPPLEPPSVIDGDDEDMPF